MMPLARETKGTVANKTARKKTRQLHLVTCNVGGSVILAMPPDNPIVPEFG